MTCLAYRVVSKLTGCLLVGCLLNAPAICICISRTGLRSQVCVIHTDTEAAAQTSYFTVFFVGCLTSQQLASVSQGRICSDNFTCCHTEIEVADQTFHLTQSQYTNTRSTSPSTDPIEPGAWQGSHWSANF